MRIGAFLFGTIVGAASVLYLNRNNKTIVASFSQLGDSMNRFMDKAILNIADKNPNLMKGKNTGSLGEIEDLVNRDPQVKKEVNEIFKQNNLPAH